jgi:hypothetical protein
MPTTTSISTMVKPVRAQPRIGQRMGRVWQDVDSDRIEGPQAEPSRDWDQRMPQRMRSAQDRPCTRCITRRVRFRQREAVALAPRRACAQRAAAQHRVARRRLPRTAPVLARAGQRRSRVSPADRRWRSRHRASHASGRCLHRCGQRCPRRRPRPALEPRRQCVHQIPSCRRSDHASGHTRKRRAPRLPLMCCAPRARVRWRCAARATLPSQAPPRSRQSGSQGLARCGARVRQSRTRARPVK